MWADLLPKESCLPKDLEDVLVENKMDLGDSHINKVRAFGQEVRMTNIHIRSRAVDTGGDVT